MLKYVVGWQSRSFIAIFGQNYGSFSPKILGRFFWSKSVFEGGGAYCLNCLITKKELFLRLPLSIIKMIKTINRGEGINIF